MSRRIHINLFYVFLLSLALVEIGAKTNGTERAGSQLPKTVNSQGRQVFLNGANIAWNEFSWDLSSPTTVSRFNSWFGDIKRAGGNAVRWWLHINGNESPIWSGSLVASFGSRLGRVKEILDVAQGHGIMVEICLWSFDMFDARQLYNICNGDHSCQQNRLDRNADLFRNEKSLMAYVNNAEGLNVGWFEQACNGFRCPSKLTPKEIGFFVNRIAGAIRRTDSSATVTVGSGFKCVLEDWWYSDSALISAGGDSQGTLTHYSVHYYPWGNPTGHSPFHNSATKWNAGKPISIGEFPARGFDASSSDQQRCGQKYLFSSDKTMSIASAYKFAYDTGYAGVFGWQYISANADYCTNAMIGDWDDLQYGVGALKGYSCVSNNPPPPPPSSIPPSSNPPSSNPPSSNPPSSSAPTSKPQPAPISSMKPRSSTGSTGRR